MDSFEVEYLLPVTLVTIAGTRTTVVNHVAASREVTTRAVQIGIEITADTASPQRLTVDPAQWGRRSVSVSLAPDGRLTGVNSVFEDRSGERVKAALQVGAAAAGAVSPFTVTMGPLGAAVAAAAGLATAGMAYSVQGAVSLYGLWRPEMPDAGRVPAEQAGQQGEAPQRPSPKDLGIHPRYAQEFELEAEVLADLRWSQALLTARLAKVTGQPGALLDGKALARELSDLSKALRTVRASLAEADTAYASWVAEQATTTHTDHYREVFTLDQLPTEQGLREAAQEGFVPARPKGGPNWPGLFEDLRVAVSVDLLTDETGTGVPAHQLTEQAPRGHSHEVAEPPHGHMTVVYRRPQVAVITRWGIDRGPDGKYRLTPEQVDRKVVVLPGAERVLPLLHGEDDRTVTAEYDADGLLTGASIDQTDARSKRAQVLGSAPGLVKDAFTTGAGLTQPWSAADRAAALKAEVELLEARTQLAQARGPAAPTDPLQRLRDDLEEAELRARLVRAQTLIAEPTRSLYLLQTVTTAT